MRRIFTLILCLLFLCTSIPVHATDSFETTTVLENGLRVVEEMTIITNSRSTEKSAIRSQTIYDGDTLVAEIAFKATFRYDGTNVIVIYRNVTQADTYHGWSYTQESFTDSGGTVTLTGTLKYLLVFQPTTLTMSLTCDANGNISY